MLKCYCIRERYRMEVIRLTLKDAMDARGVTAAFLAKKIGISENAFYFKRTGRNEFKQSEIKTISKVLGLDGVEILEIFFDQKVD